MAYIGKRTKEEFIEGNSHLPADKLAYIVARCEKFTNPEGAMFMAEGAYGNVADADDSDEVICSMDCIIDTLVDSFGFEVKEEA